MEVARASCDSEVLHPEPRYLGASGSWPLGVGGQAPGWHSCPCSPPSKASPPLPAGPASACLLLMLLALPPAAPSCPMLCTCYSSPPTVSCQANNFSSVPLSLPPSTQRLFLQNNLIRTLRPGTFGPNLLTLWLFSNNLSTIYPGTFRHLQALEELDLGDNRHLRSLEPDTFQGLERLQSLHLYRCQLSSLPGNIFRGLVSLQYLYLQENSLLHLQVSRPPGARARTHTGSSAAFLSAPLSCVGPSSLPRPPFLPQHLGISLHFSVLVLGGSLSLSPEVSSLFCLFYLPLSVGLSMPVGLPRCLSLSHSPTRVPPSAPVCLSIPFCPSLTNLPPPSVFCLFCLSPFTHPLLTHPHVCLGVCMCFFL